MQQKKEKRKNFCCRGGALIGCAWLVLRSAPQEEQKLRLDWCASASSDKSMRMTRSVFQDAQEERVRSDVTLTALVMSYKAGIVRVNRARGGAKICPKDHHTHSHSQAASLFFRLFEPPVYSLKLCAVTDQRRQILIL